MHSSATARAAGTCHLNPPSIQRTPPPSATNGARKATSAKRRAQAMTRLPRIAVLVQNSSVVGPISSTASMATMTPKTTLATWPSGTVLGSGIMNRAKIRTSGEVTRICPQIAAAHRGHDASWRPCSGPGAWDSATARNAANAIMKPNTRPSIFSSHAISRPPPTRIT